MQVVTARTDIRHVCNWHPATIAVGTGYMPTEQERGRPRLNSDICARHDWHQALTGLNPRQLLEDVDTGEIIWQHQAGLTPAGEVSHKMVCYHFKDRYQSATEYCKRYSP